MRSLPGGGIDTAGTSGKIEEEGKNMVVATMKRINGRWTVESTLPSQPVVLRLSFAASNQRVRTLH